MNSPSQFVEVAPSLARIRAIGDFMEAKYPKRIMPTRVMAAICGGDYRKFRTGYLDKLQRAFERSADEKFHCLPGIVEDEIHHVLQCGLLTGIMEPFASTSESTAPRMGRIGSLWA